MASLSWRKSRFANPVQRLDHGEEFDAIIVDAVKDRTMEEMFKTASEEYGMLFGISQSPEGLTDCPQLAAREFYQDIDHPVIGKTKIPFRLFHVSESRSSRGCPRLYWASTMKRSIRRQWATLRRISLDSVS